MGGSRLLGAKLDQGAGISGGSVTSFQKLFFSLQDRDKPKQGCKPTGTPGPADLAVYP